MSQHHDAPHDDDNKPASIPTPPAAPLPEPEPSQDNVYTFAVTYFGIPLILLILMILATNA